MITSVKTVEGYWIHQTRINGNIISYKYQGSTKAESLKKFKAYIKQLK